jgi:hypothetical protein
VRESAASTAHWSTTRKVWQVAANSAASGPFSPAGRMTIANRRSGEKAGAFFSQSWSQAGTLLGSMWQGRALIKMAGQHLNVDSILLFLWLAYWGWVWGGAWADPRLPHPYSGNIQRHTDPSWPADSARRPSGEKLTQ